MLIGQFKFQPRQPYARLGTTTKQSNMAAVEPVNELKECLRGSALGNIGWSGPDWSEFPDRPCDVIVRLITKKQIYGAEGLNLLAASSVGRTFPQFAHWTTDKAVFFEDGWMFTCLYRFIFAYRFTRCYLFVLLQRTLRNIYRVRRIRAQPQGAEESYLTVFLVKFIVQL